MKAMNCAPLSRGDNDDTHTHTAHTRTHNCTHACTQANRARTHTQTLVSTNRSESTFIGTGIHRRVPAPSVVFVRLFVFSVCPKHVRAALFVRQLANNVSRSPIVCTCVCSESFFLPMEQIKAGERVVFFILVFFTVSGSHC